ncbi:hypothetical protein AMTRI_Chr02g261970 [Amborella trichopoda]
MKCLILLKLSFWLSMQSQVGKCLWKQNKLFVLVWKTLVLDMQSWSINHHSLGQC